MDEANKWGAGRGAGQAAANSAGRKRQLGLAASRVPSKIHRGFVSPVIKNEEEPSINSGNNVSGKVPSFVQKALEGDHGSKEEELPEALRGCDPKLVEMIMNEIMTANPGVRWDDIAGLKFAKKCVMEAVVWPLIRPDLFRGLLNPPKGILLFGPPGTGKTLIGKAIASQAQVDFCLLSASVHAILV